MREFVGIVNRLPGEIVFGPSGVCALPLGIAAERHVHYIWYYFSFFSVPHTFLLERVALGV